MVGDIDLGIVSREAEWMLREDLEYPIDRMCQEENRRLSTEFYRISKGPHLRGREKGKSLMVREETAKGIKTE